MQQQLCPNCRIGKVLFELDPGNPECPYITMNNGKFCAKFEKIKKTDGGGLAEEMSCKADE